jgi:hypothetical protein
MTAEPREMRGERTEQMTRKFDADGKLISEIRTVELVVTPADNEPPPGFYL